MPDDFYLALREQGGSEPYDNVYFLSPDSISRESYYYDFHSVNPLRPDRSQVEAVYQGIRRAMPSSIAIDTDEVDRVYARGGEIIEVYANGQLISRANAGRYHVRDSSLQAFRTVADAARNEVLGMLQGALRRVEAEFQAPAGEQVTLVRLLANDFPLLSWEGDGPPPPLGSNALLPGDYHLFLTVRSQGGTRSIQDTLQVRGAPRGLAVALSAGSLEIKKLY